MSRVNYCAGECHGDRQVILESSVMHVMCANRGAEATYVFLRETPIANARIA